MAESPEDFYHRMNPNIETLEILPGIRHSGTRKALIAAGLAIAGQFPGEPGCGTTSTVFPGEGERVKIQVRRRSPYLYDVLVYWTPEEEKLACAKRSAAVVGRLAKSRQRTLRASVTRTEGDRAFQRFMSVATGASPRSRGGRP